MTYADFFYEIKSRFMEADVSDIHEHLAFQFNVVNPGCGGIFNVEVKDGKLDPVTAFVCASTLSVASVAGITYFYRRTMIRQNAKMERTVKMAGTDWSQYKDMLAKRKQFMMEQKREDVYVQSFDDLKLHGVYFPAINGNSNNVIGNSDKKRVIICMHGYTSRSMQDFTGLTDYYFKHGFAMLQTDARAHGESEGDYIGFGCLDRKELLKWIDWVIDYCGDDTEIYLHGISMGASTALMASGLDLPSQVKGIISDCEFTSPRGASAFAKDCIRTNLM